MTDERHDIHEDVSAYLDGELDAGAREAFEARMAESLELQREVEALRRIDALYAQMPSVNAPDSLEARVLEAVRPAVIRFRRRRAEPQRVWPMLAAAAGVAVMLGLFALQFRAPVAVDPAGVHLAKQTPAQGHEGGKGAGKGRSDAAPEPPAMAASPPKDNVYLLDMSAPETEPPVPKPMRNERVESKSKEEPRKRIADDPARDAEVLGAPHVMAGRGINEDHPGDALTLRQLVPSESAPVAAPGIHPKSAATQDEIGPTSAAPAGPQVPALEADGVAPLPSDRVSGGNEVSPVVATDAAADAAAPSQVAVRDAREPSAPTGRKTVIGREFELFDGVWRESTYANEEVRTIRRGGPIYRRLLEVEPRLDDTAALGEKVILNLRDTWYLIAGPASD